MPFHGFKPAFTLGPVQFNPESSLKPFLASIGVRMPIIQAPMAGISTPEMAAAVTNAGALGSLGVGAMTAAMAGEAIVKTSLLTSGPFNVNVFCHAPAKRNSDREASWLAHLSSNFTRFEAAAPPQLAEPYPSFQDNEELFEVLLDLRPAVVSFHFGLPSDARLSQLRSAGVRLIATATSWQEAEQISAAGLDAIVAQGYEAGGHRGVFDPGSRDEKMSTSVLTQRLVHKKMLPVIASGGIMYGSTIAGMLMLGAEAAQLGTAFLMCPESAADTAYRQALHHGETIGTTMTKAISGRPARSLNNAFTALGSAQSCPAVPDYPIAYAAGKALHAVASQQGSSAYAAHWAGQGVGDLRSLSAGDLTRALHEECKEAMSSKRRCV